MQTPKVDTVTGPFLEFYNNMELIQVVQHAA